VNKVLLVMPYNNGTLGIACPARTSALHAALFVPMAHATSASILKLCARALFFDFAATRLRSGRTGWDIAFMHRFGVDALVACAARTSAAPPVLPRAHGTRYWLTRG